MTSYRFPPLPPAFPAIGLNLFETGLFGNSSRSMLEQFSINPRLEEVFVRGGGQIMVLSKLSEKGTASLEYTMLAAIFALTLVGSANSFGESLHSFGERRGAQFLQSVNKEGTGSPRRLPYGGGTDTSTVRPKSGGINIPPSGNIPTVPPKTPPPPDSEPVTE